MLRRVFVVQLVAVVAVATVVYAPDKVSLAAHSSEGDDTEGRQWPSGRCIDGPSGRPALITAYLATRSGKSWLYWDALRAMRRSGMSTEVTKRAGKRHWDAFAVAGGTVGRLLPVMKKLRRQEPPRKRDSTPLVHLTCAGHRYNTKRFFLILPTGVRPRPVIRRNGGDSLVRRYLPPFEGETMWLIRRRDHSGTIQRARAYLDDRDVHFVELESSRPLEPYS